ncbi:MAG: hypothetical protein OEV77_05115 [Nitrospira sp.]|nr:hypothetical protein [Nitrospira sp.]
MDCLARFRTQIYSVGMISAEAAKSHRPNCQAERLDGVDECIRCGIIFTKYRLLAKRAAVSPSQTPFMESRWWLAAKQWLIESDETTDSLTLVGRAMLFLSLVCGAGRSSSRRLKPTAPANPFFI